MRKLRSARGRTAMASIRPELPEIDGGLAGLGLDVMSFNHARRTLSRDRNVPTLLPHNITTAVRRAYHYA